MDFKRLKTVRKGMKMTIGQAARTVGCHRNTIARIERGEKNVEVGIVIAYVGALGLKLVIAMD